MTKSFTRDSMQGTMRLKWLLNDLPRVIQAAMPSDEVRGKAYKNKAFQHPGAGPGGVRRPEDDGRWGWKRAAPQVVWGVWPLAKMGSQGWCLGWKKPCFRSPLLSSYHTRDFMNGEYQPMARQHWRHPVCIGNLRSKPAPRLLAFAWRHGGAKMAEFKPSAQLNLAWSPSPLDKMVMMVVVLVIMSRAPMFQDRREWSEVAESPSQSSASLDGAKLWPTLRFMTASNWPWIVCPAAFCTQ